MDWGLAIILFLVGCAIIFVYQNWDEIKKGLGFPEDVVEMKPDHSHPIFDKLNEPSRKKLVDSQTIMIINKMFFENNFFVFKKFRFHYEYVR